MLHPVLIIRRADIKLKGPTHEMYFIVLKEWIFLTTTSL